MIKDEKSPELEQDENKNQEEEETTEETQEEETSDQKESESKEDDTDWKAEALKQKAINDRLNKRISKPVENKASKSDEFDYGKKAFLTANGIKGSKEFDFVKDEAKKANMELDELLENEYFQSKLDKFRALNKTAEATIKGKDSKGIQTDSVEYWMNKPIEEVPHEMRIKVVNAKLKQDQSKGIFYNQK